MIIASVYTVIKKINQNEYQYKSRSIIYLLGKNICLYVCILLTSVKLISCLSIYLTIVFVSKVTTISPVWYMILSKSGR